MEHVVAENAHCTDAPFPFLETLNSLYAMFDFEGM